MTNGADHLTGEMAQHPSAPARSVVMGAKRMGPTRPQKPRTASEGPESATHTVNAAHRIIADAGPTEAAATIRLDVRALATSWHCVADEKPAILPLVEAWLRTFGIEGIDADAADPDGVVQSSRFHPSPAVHPSGRANGASGAAGRF